MIRGTPEQPHSEIEALKPESILGRKEIVAPPGFVSVYHAITNNEILPIIDREGLRQNIEGKITSGTYNPEAYNQLNAAIDKYRPKHLIDLGVSRKNIYAYPFLQYGNGLSGASRRYEHAFEDERSLRRIYGGETFEKERRYWKDNYGIETEDELIRKLKDIKFQRILHPQGEVLELKIDPQMTFVGNMEHFVRIYDDKRHLPEAEAIRINAERYWEDIISLDEFLQWYRKPEYAEDGDTIKDAEQFRDPEIYSAMGFHPLKDAPKHLPEKIDQPEILIPYDVPQEMIRVLE